MSGTSVQLFGKVLIETRLCPALQRTNADRGAFPYSSNTRQHYGASTLLKLQSAGAVYPVHPRVEHGVQTRWT